MHHLWKQFKSDCKNIESDLELTVLKIFVSLANSSKFEFFIAKDTHHSYK